MLKPSHGMAALALLLAGLSALWAAGFGTELRINSFNGRVQIKRPDGSYTGLVSGMQAPDITPGSEVLVLSGDAVFSLGDVSIKADKGDFFGFNIIGGAMQITAIGHRTAFTLNAGKYAATMRAGDSIAIAPSGRGETLTVVSGRIPITTAGAAPQTLIPGQMLAP